ncbi:hypothetical protein ACLI08_11780 [Flavobacterium sp. RNTU_13]|uniref:hypothetical protein n=1 Tax=Flavobacterium sp. RNTU_13 TaxID=3375145 RepID=UPI003985C01D
MKPTNLLRIALYFFSASFLTLMYGIFAVLPSAEKNVHLSIADTDILLDKFELTIVFKVGLLVISIGYLIAAKLHLPLISALTMLHALLTFGSMICCGICSLLLSRPVMENVAFWLVATSLGAQLLFVINIGYGMLNRKICPKRLSEMARS